MTLAIQYESKPDEIVCPICKRALPTKKCKPLNGVMVCTRDRNKFANRRQGAYLLDYLVLFFLSTFLGLGWSMVAAPPTMAGQGFFADELFWAGMNWLVVPLIFAMKDGFGGRSPGKMICGVQVIDKESRLPIGFGRSFKRNLCNVVPVIPLVNAFMLISGRRLGDRWANTMVIWNKHAHSLPFDPRGVLCQHCGYDLTGNVSGRCSECGNAITFSPTAIPPDGLSRG